MNALILTGIWNQIWQHNKKKSQNGHRMAKNQTGDMEHMLSFLWCQKVREQTVYVPPWLQSGGRPPAPSSYAPVMWHLPEGANNTHITKHPKKMWTFRLQKLQNYNLNIVIIRIIFILRRGQSPIPRPLPQSVVFCGITATSSYSCCGRKIVLGEYNCPSAWTENIIYGK